MSKPLLVLMVVLAIGFVSVSIIFAQEEATPPAETVEELIYTPKLLPDSPFYFLKGIKEKIELFLAQASEAQAEKYAELATRRVAEAKLMIHKNKFQFVVKLLNEQQDYLQKAQEKIKEAQREAKDVQAVAAIVARATNQHLGVLADVYEQVPEPAQEAIQQAIESASQGQEKALEALSTEKKEELEEWFEEKLGEKQVKIKEVIKIKSGQKPGKLEIKEVLPE